MSSFSRESDINKEVIDLISILSSNLERSVAMIISLQSVQTTLLEIDKAHMQKIKSLTERVEKLEKLQENNSYDL